MGHSGPLDGDAAAAKTNVGTGDVVGDRFVIVACLGEGGNGTVYRALDRRRDAVVALKLLRRVGPADIYHFKREFRTLADVTHRNLVPLYELIATGDQWMFTMEVIDGVDVLHYIRGETETRTSQENATVGILPSASREAPASPSTFEDETRSLAGDTPFRPRRILGRARTGERRAEPISTPEQFARLRDGLGQLVQGAMALHRAGQLHRDIKPSNVLVTQRGRVVLLDFGIVGDLAEARAGAGTERRLQGTPAYMAPEQAARRPQAEASDWYAVGVILYEALTGARPWEGGLDEVLAAKRQWDARPVRSLTDAAPDDLASLCMELLARDPHRRPSGDEILARLGAAPESGSVPLHVQDAVRGELLVGRDRELGVLRDAAARVRAGELLAAFVHGPSGIGKSALAARFIADLQAAGEATVIGGRCFERESVPHKALDSLIDGLTRYLMELPEEEVRRLLPEDALPLAQLFPVLRRVGPVAKARAPAATYPDPRERRRRAVAALRAILQNLAAKSLLVLYLDDLQWGDRDSATLLAEALRSPGAPALLLLGTYRDVDVDASPFLGQFLPTQPDAVHVQLSPLWSESSVELARSVLTASGTPAPEAVLTSIARESAGNPFFVTELAQYVIDPVTSSRVSFGGLSLEDLLRSRFDQLPADALRLLVVLAVAGRPLSRSVARLGAGITVGDTAPVLQLRSAKLVRSHGSEADELLVTYHDRIRETVVSDLDAETLRNCHAGLVRALEQTGGADPDTMSIHYEGAGDIERAYRLAREAAESASETLAFDRAVALYERAVRLCPDDPAPTALRGGYADALANAGLQVEAAREFLDAAVTSDEATAFEYRRRAAKSFFSGGRIDEGVDTLRNVLRAVNMRIPSWRPAALVRAACWRVLVRLRGLRLAALPESGLRPEVRNRLDACATATAGLLMNHHVQATEFAARLLFMALRSGDEGHSARAVIYEVLFASLQGRRGAGRATRILDLARELAERSGEPEHIAVATAVSGAYRYAMGDWRLTHDRCSDAEIIFREKVGNVWEYLSVRVYQLWALYYLGQLGDLAERVFVWLEDAHARGDLYFATQLCTGLPAAAWLARDDPSEARALADENMGQWSRRGYHMQHFWYLFSCVQGDLYSGEARVALDQVESGWRALARSLLLRVSPVRVEAFDIRARCALAAAADGRDTRAILRRAERCARAMERTQIAYAVAMAGVVRAGVSAMRGDDEASATGLRAAAEQLDAANMVMHAACTRRQLGRLLGGDEGAGLVTAADASLHELGIAAPERMAALLAPGFKEP